MTDRSSEERSRFEKLEAAFVRLSRKYGKDWAEWQDVRDAFDEFREARAALEDRQEAAPLHRVVIDNPLAQFTELSLEMCVHSQGGDFQDRMRCFPSAKFHMWCDLGRILQNRGVPSEATPSKEEKMIGSTGRIHKKTHDCETAGCRPAPAPEVQGTPAKEKNDCLMCDEDEICQHDPELKDALRGQVGKAIANVSARAPVGTPQKETPPKQCTWVDRMDFTGGIQCNFQRGHKGQHSFEKAATVPEGVQGKEPQTFEQRYAEKDQALEERARAYENTDGSDSVYSLLAGFAFQERKAAYLSGEAAGRRSAITEMQEWILTVREDPFDPWSAGYNKGYDAVSKKCTELLEKTK